MRENFHVKRNGQEEKIHTDHGYVKIETKVYKDTFEITFDAPPVSFMPILGKSGLWENQLALVKGMQFIAWKKQTMEMAWHPYW